MLLPTCCFLAHLCPLLEFVLRSLNTGHLRPEGEGVAAVLHFNLGVVVLLLSFFRLIRLLLYNRHPQQQPHRSTLIIWLLRLENSQMSLRI
jgi:cytochrome b561